MRIFVTMVAVFVLTGHALAASPRTVGVILYAKPFMASFEGLRDGLEAIGYVEGRDIQYMVRIIDGDLSRVPAIMAEFQGAGAAFVLTTTSNVAIRVKELAGSVRIPILFNEVADPLEIGLVDSLESPGGNITGVSHIANRLLPKRLAVFRDCFPGLESVIIFNNPAEKFSRERIALLNPVANEIGVRLRVVEFSSQHPLDEIAKTIEIGENEGIFISPSPQVTRHMNILAGIARKHRVPLMVHDNNILQMGGSIGYSPSFYDVGVQSATIGAMLMSGIDPGRIPVQSPADVSLMLNFAEIKRLSLPVSGECVYYASELIR